MTTILNTIKENDKPDKNVSIEKIRAHHADKNFKEIGAELDRLKQAGKIYESSPGKMGYI